MKKSITFKMTAMLIAIIGMILFLIWILNITFAEKFYIATEKASIIRNYEEVKYYLSEDETWDSLYDNLDQLSNISNVRMTIIQTDPLMAQKDVIFSNMADGSIIYQDILDYLYYIRNELLLESEMQDENSNRVQKWFNSRFDHNLTTLLEKGYYVTEIQDKYNDQRGLYLFGFTDDDYLVALRVSVEGIRTSVAINSKFISWIGAFGIILGSICMMIYAYHFTRPIKAMAQVATQISHLDFETKVNVRSNDDEIGELAKSINLLSENLETTIADLKSANLSLQKDIQEKEEVDEMRKEFLSHVSHELKTPIAIIQGYAEGLKEGVADDPESMEYYCQVIVDEAQKMNTMVKKLLTLNQIEFSKDPLNISRFHLNQMITNKIMSSKVLMADKKPQILFEEKEERYVWADEYMIEEVFTNYLTNAIHHVKENGVIRISFEDHDSSLRVYVFNEGKQISEENLDKIWIKFYKTDKARSREYGGNGIGLSIVAAIMNAHGKSYGVENRENGVAFYFDLDTESQNC